MIIYLIGFMGVGKSTVGVSLAKKLKYSFVDTDSMIEEVENRSISEIFAKSGEAYFRKIERDTLITISSGDDMVVSCGGGIITDDDNISIMRDSGLVVLLEAAPHIIATRLKDDDTRPLLRAGKDADRIGRLIEERGPMYDKACHIRVNSAMPVDDIVSLIASKLYE